MTAAPLSKPMAYPDARLDPGYPRRIDEHLGAALSLSLGQHRLLNGTENTGRGAKATSVNPLPTRIPAARTTDERGETAPTPIKTTRPPAVQTRHRTQDRPAPTYSEGGL